MHELFTHSKHLYKPTQFIRSVEAFRSPALTLIVQSLKKKHSFLYTKHVKKRLCGCVCVCIAYFLPLHESSRFFLHKYIKGFLFI